MGDQWPDPNGKWMRRTRRWTLPAGVAYLAVLVLYIAACLIGQEPMSAFRWVYLGLSTLVACSLIGMGIAYRRADSRPR